MADRAVSAPLVPDALTEGTATGRTGKGSRDAELAGITALEGRRTVENVTADNLRESILNGTLAPGARLPIRALALRLGVSVMPVRIALKQLSAEGLVDLAPHSGASVTRLTVDEIEELIVTRGDGIESWLALMGAPALTDAALAEMTDALARVGKAVASGDQRQYLAESWALRVPCYAAAGRPRMLERASMLFRYSMRYHLLNLAEKDRLEWSFEMYNRFIDACRRRDGSLARDITREGLEWTLDYLATATKASTG